MYQAFSVEPIAVPTWFHRFDAAAHVERCNLAGCENHRVSARALEAIADPDPEWLRDHWFAQDDTLRRSLAELHRVAPAQVHITSGALGAIAYAFAVFTRPGTHVGILGPDWPGFRYFAEHARADIHYLRRQDFPFQFDLGALVDFVRAAAIDFMILSNPSAVTGSLWEAAELAALLAACPETLFVIDEADAIHPDLSGAHLAEQYDNVVFLGSFSKFYGLSGLRIGYLVSPVVHAAAFAATINPAEVTAPSIVAARAALGDRVFQAETQATVAANLRSLAAAVASTPYQLVPGSRCFAAYLWADESVEDPQVLLARRGIDVAAAAVFGLRRGGRINLADPAKIAALTAALAGGRARGTPRRGPGRVSAVSTGHRAADAAGLTTLIEGSNLTGRD